MEPIQLQVKFQHLFIAEVQQTKSNGALLVLSQKSIVFKFCFAFCYFEHSFFNIQTTLTSNLLINYLLRTKLLKNKQQIRLFSILNVSSRAKKPVLLILYPTKRIEICIYAQKFEKHNQQINLSWKFQGKLQAIQLQKNQEFQSFLIPLRKSLTQQAERQQEPGKQKVESYGLSTNIRYLLLTSKKQVPSMKQTDNTHAIQYDQVNSNPSIASREFTKASLLQQRFNCMFQMPPTQHHAQIHLKANKFGITAHIDPHRQITVCPCCQVPLYSQELLFWTSTTPTTEEGIILEPFQLQNSVCLYFTFIKLITVYLLTLFLTVSIFSLSMNSVSELQCKLEQTWCKSFFLNYSPFKHKIENYKAYLQITDYLNLTMILISIVLFQFYKKYQRKLHATLRITQRSQQDFSILVENIPKIIMEKGVMSFKYEKMLKGLLEDNYQLNLKNNMHRKYSIQSQQQADNRLRHSQHNTEIVKSICLCIKTSELDAMKSYRQEILQQMLNGEMSASATTQARAASQQNTKLALLNKQFIIRSQELWHNRSYTWAISHFLGSAIVSFQRQSKRNSILEFYRQSPEMFTIQGRQLRISVAPMPEDIEWSDLNLEEKKGSALQFFSLCFILFSFGFLAIEYFDQSKVQLKGRQISAFRLSEDVVHQNSFLRDLAIASITHFNNFLIELLADYLSSQQKQMTKTRKHLSTVSKTIIAQSMNTIGMFLLLSAISSQKNLLKNGIVNRVCYFLFFMSSLSVIFSLFQISHLRQKIAKMLFAQKPMLNKGVQLYYNQSKQLLKFDFNSNCSFYILLIYTTMFFSYIAPLCTPIIMTVIFVNYWVNKHNLFKNCSKSQPLDLEFFQILLKFVQFSIVLFGLGNFYFSYLIQGKPRMVNLIALGLTILYFVMTIFEQKFFQNLACGQHTSFYDNGSYSECLKNGRFLRNYWSSNPATRVIDQPDLNTANKKADYNINFRMADQQDLKKYQ